MIKSTVICDGCDAELNDGNVTSCTIVTGFVGNEVVTRHYGMTCECSDKMNDFLGTLKERFSNPALTPAAHPEEALHA